MYFVKRTLFLLSFFLLSSPAWTLQRASGFVTDQANVIEPVARERLENALVEFERRSSIELAVVTVQSLDGNDVAEVANKLFREWGIGKKSKDNGVLLLIAPNDRRMRIEVGYGLEGQLTDAGAGRILDEAVVPYFKQGDMTSGIINGASAIAEKLTGAPLQIQGPIRSSSDRNPPSLTGMQKLLALIFILFFLIVIARHPWLLLWFLSSRGGGGWSGGGFGGSGGFGGFGGGSSGGGGASRGW